MLLLEAVQTAIFLIADTRHATPTSAFDRVLAPLGATEQNEREAPTMKSAIFFGLAASLTLGLSTPGLTDDLKAEPRFEGTTVAFNVPANLSNLMLSVSGPFNFHASATARSGSPSIDLRRSGGVDDGAYTYNLTAATDEPVKSRTELDNGRGTAGPGLTSVSTSGTFNVLRGAIVPLRPRPPVTQDPKSRQDQP
jgi:hypothetical protein